MLQFRVRVCSYRLQALLYFRLYNIRRSETVKLKKVIDDYNKVSYSVYFGGINSLCLLLAK